MPANRSQKAALVINNVASATSSTQIFGQNAAGQGRIVVNDSSANLYLLFNGAAASVTSFTVKLAAGAMYEFQQPWLYNGQVNGIWDAANGFARITEW